MGDGFRTEFTPTGITWAVDAPIADAVVPLTGFLLSGWARNGMAPLERVVARHAGRDIGSASVIYVRDDVGLGARCGYRIFVQPGATDQPGPYAIELFATFADTEVEAGLVTCTLTSFDERQLHYGVLSTPDYATVLHRSDIYSVGPPSRDYSMETLGLLFSYIEPHSSVLDVGCGAAPYAQPFRASGRRWSGCELRPDLVAEHQAAGLPVAQADGEALPFAAGSFDFVTCVEVLEHVDDYETFVGEIARVVRHGACFSVPSVRAIPRLAPQGVVPWHLLEATHVNFFGPASLRALLARHFRHVVAFEYGALPIAAVDSTPIFNHVFAVGMHHQM